MAGPHTEAMEAEDFLELLWGDEDSDGGWVDLPAKVNGYWIPYPLEWPTTDGGTGVSRRIDQSLRDEEDLYFSVARFVNRGRSLPDVLPIGWLWADLDEVHPSVAAGMGLMPTIAVESSPGRYQAYWRLDKEHSPQVIERINRGLTYALGADKGGWDLTQVLRIPGTRNQKYKGAPLVRLMYHNEGLVYKARGVWRVVKEHVPQGELAGVTENMLPRQPIPRKAKQLLWAKSEDVVHGERSARLWELNCLLAESGLDEEEIYALVTVSVWNKWRTTGSGAARLRQDIRKAMTHVRRKAVERGRGGRVSDVGSVDSTESDSGAVDNDGDPVVDSGAGDGDAGGDIDEDGNDDTARLRFISYSSLMAMVIRRPKWLIEDIWTAGSHGIIGGEPKTSKTTLALAMGIAVASGTDFLGQFRVGVQGPVLMVEEENGLQLMQRRAHQLSAYSGVIDTRDAVVTPATPGSLESTVVSLDTPPDMPLWFLSKCGFDLSVEDHREFLLGYIEEIQPAFLILDPMYLVLGQIDANSMRDLQPYLKWVIKVANGFNCAVALVHHSGKRTESNAGRRAGQRLMGSATLHGFVDSALYTTKLKDEREGWTRVHIEREFRSLPDQQALEMAWSFGEGLDVEIEVGSAKQRVHVEGDGRVRMSRIERQIAALVKRGEISTVSDAARHTGHNTQLIKRHIRNGESLGLEESGKGKSPRIVLNGARHG